MAASVYSSSSFSYLSETMEHALIISRYVSTIIMKRGGKVHEGEATLVYDSFTITWNVLLVGIQRP